MTHVLAGKTEAALRVDILKRFIRERNITPRVTAITISPDQATEQFLRIKKRVASESGIEMRVVALPHQTSLEEVEQVVLNASAQQEAIVLQLPLPNHIPLSPLLELLPYELDPDCIGKESLRRRDLGTGHVLAPVVSAIRSVLSSEHISVRGKNVVIVGHGRLVGEPAAIWFRSEGARVTTLTREDGDIASVLRLGDIVVLGAGSPHLIVPDMLKEGVVLFDAGTSEEGGRVVGDAHPSCKEKASLFTPVPGGLGPLAVVELFLNVLRLQFDYKDGT